MTFIGFVVVAFLADASTAHWVARYARGIAALILSLISFASLFFTPFTEYAREQVPEQYWGSPSLHLGDHRSRSWFGASSGPPPPPRPTPAR